MSQLQAIKSSMYEVRLGKSKQLASRWIDKYNLGQINLRDRVRQSHRDLAEKLIYYYYKQIRTEQAFGNQLRPGDKLPSLRTNNRQLCQALKCHENSIINQRKRLKQAGLIQMEVYHGTYADYEIHLNPAILHVQCKAGKQNEVGQFLNFEEKLIASLPNHMSQNLGPTVTSTYQVTKELIELSGVDFPQIADSQSLDTAKDVENCKNTVENAPGSVENPQNSVGQGTPLVTDGTGNETGKTAGAPAAGNTPPSSAAPPQRSGNVPADTSPIDIREVLSHLPGELAGQITRKINLIWACVELNLYQDAWLSDSQVEAGKALLAEYLAYAKPSKYQAGTNEIIERIMLVKRWLDTAPKGEKRWIPLPNAYFDFRNETNGFRKTKSWLKHHRMQKSQIFQKGQLTRYINLYVKACEPGSTHSRSDIYRKAQKRLGRINPELLQKFNEIILSKNESDNETAQAS